jgi:hypothetical protein
MIEDIRSRIDPLPDYADMNPYQLWFDCRYLLSEVDYYKRMNKELERQISESQECIYD